MKPKNRIYLLFIVPALVFWNPVSFYFIYGGTAIYSFKLIHALFWTAFIVFLFTGYLLVKNKVGRKWANLLFSFVVTGILFSLVVLINAIVGLVAPVKVPAGLLFEPGSVAHYQSCEFKFMASINSLGLRDREIDTSKRTNYRVLCVGDSWTFGWGVGVENSWPKKLEQYLEQNGIKNVEVINGGRPGMSTIDYREHLKEMASVLKPDLVLLGVLQLNDLAQLYEGNIAAQKKEKVTAEKKIWYAARTFLVYSVKNILALTKKKPGEINMQETWKASANGIINDLTPAQVLRYNMISDPVKDLYRSGDISPSVLYYYVYFPDQVSMFNNPSHPATKFALEKMNEDIAAIKEICAVNNSRLLFLDLPTHSFAGHKQVGMPDDKMDPWFETHNSIDSLYRSIAFKNNIQYFELTNGFRTSADSSDYFFRYDCHPNEKGYEKIAVLTGQYLIDSNLIKR